jgi:hypothetical protein
MTTTPGGPDREQDCAPQPADVNERGEHSDPKPDDLTSSEEAAPWPADQPLALVDPYLFPDQH